MTHVIIAIWAVCVVLGLSMQWMVGRFGARNVFHALCWSTLVAIVLASVAQGFFSIPIP